MSQETRPLPKASDVVIVGSGMAGLAAAGELQRSGLNPVILELGPNAGAEHVGNFRSFDSSNDPHFVAFGKGVNPPHYSETTGIRRRVGGRSLYWRGIALRLEQWALNDWPTSVTGALQGEKAEEGLYRDVEMHLRLWCGRALDEPRTIGDSNLVKTLQSLGYYSVRPTPRAIRVLDDGRWHAYSPIEEVDQESIYPERSFRSLRLRESRLEIEVAGCQGIERITAHRLLLCAGSTSNAQLVQLILQSTRLAPAPESFPIVDHHAQGWVCATGTPQHQNHAGDPLHAVHLSNDASVLISQEEVGASNLFLDSVQRDNLTILDAFMLGEQCATDASSMAFDQATDTASIRVELTDADHTVLASQRETLSKLAEAMSTSLQLSTEASDTTPVPFSLALERAISRRNVAVPYLCALGEMHHDSCTLPIGRGLVSETGQLEALDSVYVAGPSIFPRPGAANPGLTTLALSRYIAQNVLKSL